MKFKLKNTKLQIALEIISFTILIGMVVILILYWNNLPDKIPGHYNAAGEVDRWGSKGELVFLPITGILLYALLTAVTAFPSIWNMPTTVTEENRERVYGCIKTMMVLMKVEVLAVFFYLNYNSMHAASLSPWFLPVFLVMVFGTIIYFILRTIKLAKPQEDSSNHSY